MSSCGSRMTTRTSPPTRRSTDASVVSQSCSACHQRRMTSSLVHASNTASAGASNARCMRSVVLSVTRRARSVAVLVLVVLVPPLVRRGLRVALRRVLPLLLASQRRDVQVGPGAAHMLVAAAVDEVGAEDLLVVADEGVGAVPLAHPEVGVEVVRDGVPRHRPAHALLEPLDVLLRRARGVRECGVAGVQVGEVGHLVGSERAARAAALRPARHVRVVEEPVNDQLAASLEEVEQADRPVGPLERVVLFHGHPWHPAPLGGERVPRPRDLLLPHEHPLACGLPLRRGDDGWRVFHGHLDPSSFRYSSTSSNIRPQRARWRSIHSAASLSTSGWSDSRCVRPSTTRVTTPVSSRTRRCLLIAGLETPNPLVASPTVAGPAASRSTIPRRIGCASALNESLTTRLTVAPSPCGRLGRWPSPTRRVACSRRLARCARCSPRRRTSRPRTRGPAISQPPSARTRCTSPTRRAGCSRSRSEAACAFGSCARTSGASRSPWCRRRALSAAAGSARWRTRSIRRCRGAGERWSSPPGRRFT